MKIISIKAENIKKLKLVNLELNGDNLIVSGKPGEGKTTLIDLVWMCLTNKVGQIQPVMIGKDRAEIEVRITDPEKKEGNRVIIVKRSFADNTSKLVVSSSDGRKIGLKDIQALMESLSFNPLEFFAKKNNEQTDMLLRLLGLDFSQDDIKRDEFYNQRTMVGRDLKRVEPSAKEVCKKVEPKSATELLARLREAREHNEGIRNAMITLSDLKDSVAERKERIIALQQEIVEIKAVIDKDEKRIAKGEPIIAEMVQIDEEELAAQMETLEEHNIQARKYEDWHKKYLEYKGYESEYQSLSVNIEKLDLLKVKKLSDAHWPVPGLSIHEGIVKLLDIPLEQYGESQKLQTSFAIAASTNPALRICRIDGAESLGKEGRESIFKLANEYDMQVFMSRVSDDGPESNEIIIEDGIAVKD